MIQLSPTIVHRTWVSDGTRQNICTNAAQALSDAGWTVISGSIGSNNVTLYSPNTHPRGYRMKVNIRDEGTGQARFYLITTSDTNGGYLFFTPSNGKTIHAHATPYQLILWVHSQNLAGMWMMFSILWVPPFLTPLTAFFGNTNIEHETASLQPHTIRGNLYSYCACVDVVCWNDSLWRGCAASYQSVQGSVKLGYPQSQFCNSNSASTYAHRWADGHLHVYDPLVSWGTSSYWAYGTVKGQLWDAIIISGPFALEYEIQWRGYTWRNLTDNNNGYWSSAASLFVRMP